MFKLMFVMSLVLVSCASPLQVGTIGHYGLNEDGQCSEGCVKVDDYCDCTAPLD